MLYNSKKQFKQSHNAANETQSRNMNPDTFDTHCIQYKLLLYALILMIARC